MSMVPVLRTLILKFCLSLSWICLSACAAAPTPSVEGEGGDETAVTPSAPLAALEPLQRAEGPLWPALDINVAVFEVGSEAAETAAYMAVRTLESRLLPGLLREVLVRSDQWGVVRVVPTASALAPVNIESMIVVSDGRDLIIDVRVSDVTGEEWFRLRLAYRQDEPLDDLSALSQIFNVVSNRMGEFWLKRTATERSRLISTAGMVYARELAPDVFTDYLDEASPVLTLKRVPASDDPMLARVQRIKNQEYLFCDAMDEQLGLLLERAGPTYDLWREAAITQANWLDQYELMAASRSSGPEDGEFSRMQAEYSAYRSYRIQEQALLELAEALESESQPVVLTMEDAVITLEGTLEAQYATWRELLREIFLLEQGALL